MVTGQVKMVLGFQKSPAHSNQEPSPKPPSPSPSSAKVSAHQKAAFSRSFGVYYPRSSAQIQPKPPDVTELLRLVEDLRERESRLKTELLEHKLPKESVTIVPMLENEISNREAKLERALRRIEGLEAENKRLRMEMEESDELSSSPRFRGLMEVSGRSNLIKNLKKGRGDAYEQ